MICSLCGIGAKHPLIEPEAVFCCVGCRAVFRILETRNEKFHFEHPLYIEALREGIISNPDLIKKIDDRGSLQCERVLAEISAMGCPSCAEVIGYFLSLKAGVIKAKVDYATDLALIEYDPKKIGIQDIFDRIRSLGYQVDYFQNNGKKDRKILLQLAISSFCALNLMMFTYPLYFSVGEGGELAILSLLLSLPVVFYAAFPFYKRSFHAARAGLFGMDLLVTAAVISAFTLSTYNLWRGSFEIYYDTLAIIVTFLLFGKWIETKTKESGKEKLHEMIRHLPQRVRLDNGEPRLLKDIKAGERFVFSLGDMAPIRCKLIKGSIWVSEQAVNGESEPKYYQENDYILSGSIIDSGSALVEACEAYSDSLVNKVIEACELSFNRRHKEFSVLNFLVPFLLSISLITFFIFGFERALAVLLISCPCAIGLAAPLVRARLLKIFSEKGALVRNFEAFENLAEGDLFIFDKTGTLTAGKLTLVKLPENISIIKGLSRFSSHPLAKSLSKLEGPFEEFEQISEISGKGLIGIKRGVTYLLGSATFLKEKGVEVIFNSTKTHVILGIENKAIELCEFDDPLNEDLDLPQPRVLLSGDQERVVATVANRLGFKEWHSEKTPLEKEAYVKACKGKPIFIGDGLNDAPSLAASHCGIAVGDALSLTQASADILLVNRDLSVIKELCMIAKLGKRKIRQNFFWAFIYNLACVPLAVMGYLSPIIATLAMTVSSLFVIVNSLKSINTTVFLSIRLFGRFNHFLSGFSCNKGNDAANKRDRQQESRSQ